MYLSKKSTLLFASIIVLFFSFNSFSQKQIQNVNGRKTLSLNGDWQFIIDPYKMGYLDYRQKPFDESTSGKGGFYDNITNPGKSVRAEYNFDYEPSLVVPGDWNSQYEKLKFYEGVLWYRRNFKVSLKEHKRYFIHFGAVNYESHIYLNGKKLGVNKGGFTPFQFEVSDKLVDGENFRLILLATT